MAVVFERPKALLDVPMHFCPGLWARDCASSGLRSIG